MATISSPNFNQQCPQGKEFTVPTITQEQVQNDTGAGKGDPGFIVLRDDGTWSWWSDITSARANANAGDGIFPSYDVSSLFKPFAE